MAHLGLGACESAIANLIQSSIARSWAAKRVQSRALQRGPPGGGHASSGQRRPLPAATAPVPRCAYPVSAGSSVDLAAVHAPDGARLLVAAKSCWLPPQDPRRVPLSPVPHTPSGQGLRRGSCPDPAALLTKTQRLPRHAHLATCRIGCLAACSPAGTEPPSRRRSSCAAAATAPSSCSYWAC